MCFFRPSAVWLEQRQAFQICLCLRCPALAGEQDRDSREVTRILGLIEEKFFQDLACLQGMVGAFVLMEPRVTGR